MTQKARTNELYPYLKNKLRELAPDLVPYTSDIAADEAEYKLSKAALAGFESRARKWPRMCKLLCGRADEDGEWLFLYSEETDEGYEPAPFTKFVDDVATDCDIPVRLPIASRLRTVLDDSRHPRHPQPVRCSHPVRTVRGHPA